MRISEMSPRAVAAVPVEIDLHHTVWVPASLEERQVGYWEADSTAPLETCGLVCSNAALAEFMEAFGANDGWLDELVGLRIPVLRIILDDAGQPKVDSDGEIVTEHEEGPDGPLYRFGIPQNRPAAIQRLIGILLHRDPERVGAGMIPGLEAAYMASVLAAVSIGRGLDPTSAEVRARNLTEAGHADLSGEQIRKMTVVPEPSPTPSSSSDTAEPSNDSGA